ncbi:hypothetical protein KEG38_53220 [Polyangium jinanense]|uniref:hypothetical protein n=1 Tax=Polyangium jinanense TaxID=2829994 RepID=UPI0023414FC9|nr:hypothetical protein [Polyangium jinanense]MDC3960589.1 hypothetical protein [Polyangium jinanense]MDC3962687.1 hypothetical protein [Polyangium jinanense]
MTGTDLPRASPRQRALAGFAVVMTEAPWSIDAADLDHLRAVGLSEDGVEQAICVAAFFNYYTRVADGTGITFDYESPLPRLTIDPTREALPRPPPSDWNPAVDGSRVPVFPRRAFAQGLLEEWHAYHFERDVLLSRHERRLLARAAAVELCDAGAVARYEDAVARDPRERALAAYATKLTRTPWAASAADAAALHAHGLDDPAILAAITLVAHQNTFSRMHHGLAALATSG